MIMYEAPYVPPPAGGKTPSQHVAALWELVRADERGAAVTYFMCDVVRMPKIIGFLFRFFPMWPKLKAVAHTLLSDLTIITDTAILDGAAKQVKVPTPRCRRRQEPGLTQGGGGTGPRGDPRLPAPLARGADPQPGGRAGRGDGQRVLPGQVRSISGTPERRMGRAGHQGRSQP
jgi:hypothetical protein